MDAALFEAAPRSVSMPAWLSYCPGPWRDRSKEFPPATPFTREIETSSFTGASKTVPEIGVAAPFLLDEQVDARPGDFGRGEWRA